MTLMNKFLAAVKSCQRVPRRLYSPRGGGSGGSGGGGGGGKPSNRNMPGVASRQLKPSGNSDKAYVFPSKGRSQYEIRKFQHELPGSGNTVPFEPVAFLPCGVFRETKDEQQIGPKCTGKDNYYQDPEYFCFHHMSFFDTHYMLSPCRVQQPNSKRKCVTY